MSSTYDICASTDTCGGYTEAFVTLTVNNELRAHLPRNEGLYEAGFLLEALKARACSNIPAELQDPSNKYKLVYFKTDYSEPSLIQAPLTADNSINNKQEASQEAEGVSEAKPTTLSAKLQATQNARALVEITNAAARAAKAAASLAQQREDAESHVCLLKAVAAAEQMASEACAELARVDPSAASKSKERELMNKLQSEFRNYHLSHSVVDEERRKQLQEATEVNFDKRLKRIALYREWYKHLSEPTAPNFLQLHSKPHQHHHHQQQQPTQLDSHQSIDPCQDCITECEYHSLAKHALQNCMLELRKVKAAEEKQKYVQPITSWSQTLRVTLWRGSAVQRLRTALRLAHKKAPPLSCVPGVTSKDCMAALVKNFPALFMTKEEALNGLVAKHPELCDRASLAPSTTTNSKRKAQADPEQLQAAKMFVLSVYVRYLLGASQEYMQFFSSSNSNSTAFRGCIDGVGTSCVAGEGRVQVQAADAHSPQLASQQQKQQEGTEELQRSAVLAGGRSLLHRLRLMGSKPSQQELSLHQQLCTTSEVEYQQQLRAYSASPYPSLHEVLRDSVELGKISLSVAFDAETVRRSCISVGGTRTDQRSAAEEDEEEGLVVARSTASAPGLTAVASALHCKPCIVGQR